MEMEGVYKVEYASGDLFSNDYHLITTDILLMTLLVTADMLLEALIMIHCVTNDEDVDLEVEYKYEDVNHADVQANKMFYKHLSMLKGEKKPQDNNPCRLGDGTGDGGKNRDSTGWTRPNLAVIL